MNDEIGLVFHCSQLIKNRMVSKFNWYFIVHILFIVAPAHIFTNSLQIKLQNDIDKSSQVWYNIVKIRERKLLKTRKVVLL